MLNNDNMLVLCVGMLFRELQTMAPGGKVELYKVPQTPTQAQDRRDAVCKSLYERMFDLIVSRINVALDPGTEQETKKVIYMIMNIFILLYLRFVQ